jgi:glutathione peroxidase
MQIIGYPCNQFGGQEPGDGMEILRCVMYVRPGDGAANPFVPLFPLTAKVDVNGVLADKAWADMKAVCPSPWNGNTTDVGWNFETVLFTKTGLPYKRYGTIVDPIDIAGDIEYLLAQ